MSARADAAAHTLRAEGIEVTVRAEGARLVSLRDTARDREWLEAPGPAHGARDFDEGEMGGWDEMFPTIAPCRYPGSMLELADHGEVWRRPWTLRPLSATTLSAAIDVDAPPFHLERTLSLGRRRARLSYRLSTRADGLWYLWAAHPLFALRPGTALLVGPRRDATALVVARDLAPGSSSKTFAPGGEATLLDDDGASLTMRWSRSELPYVGVWLDHGAYARHPVVGIEPTNGSDDSLDVAQRTGALRALTGERRWSVEVVLGG